MSFAPSLRFCDGCVLLNRDYPCRVAKFPNLDAPGVPGSGRNWVLDAFAYIACWVLGYLVSFLAMRFSTLIIVVGASVSCVKLDVINDKTERSLLGRPLILPIYLSSPTFQLCRHVNLQPLLLPPAYSSLGIPSRQPERGPSFDRGLAARCVVGYYSPTLVGALRAAMERSLIRTRGLCHPMLMVS